MRVLIFQAATSAVAIAAMTRLADQVRGAGHSGGLRQLQAFRREKEPADQIIIALSPAEADRYKSLGAELVEVFNDTDRFIPLELPDDPNELKDFEFDSVMGQLKGDTTGFMTLEQLRAEAIERSIEVRADSTREELEHLLDLDQHAGRQAVERSGDRLAAEAGGMRASRIGVRTSDVLPSLNGLDLERMNDDQLQSVAGRLGLKVKRGAKRPDLINQITGFYADQLGVDPKAPPQSPASDYAGAADNSDLDDLDAEALTAKAEAEGVDIGRATAADTIREKIVTARAEKAGEDDDNG